MFFLAAKLPAFHTEMCCLEFSSASGFSCLYMWTLEEVGECPSALIPVTHTGGLGQVLGSYFHPDPMEIMWGINCPVRTLSKQTHTLANSWSNLAQLD